MFCKHEWKIMTEITTKAAYEMLGEVTSMEGASQWLFDRKYICILQCNKCGRLNKTIEKLNH